MVEVRHTPSDDGYSVYWAYCMGDDVMKDKDGKQLFVGDPVAVAAWHGIEATVGVVVVSGHNAWDGVDNIGVDIGEVVVEENDQALDDDDEPEFWDITTDLMGHLVDKTGYMYPEVMVTLIEPIEIEGDDDEDCI